MPTAQQVKCRCGSPMMPTAGNAEGYFCPNCDTVQSQESLFDRRKTPEDVRFDAHWAKIIREEYPPMPDGWDTAQPGSDIPPRTIEGDSNE